MAKAVIKKTQTTQKHSCRTRSMSSKAASKLNRHLNAQQKIKKFPCTQEGCNKMFSTISALKTHDNTHTKAQPHECNHRCRARFGDPASRGRHERETHEPWTARTCPNDDCNKPYNRLSDFERHFEQCLGYPPEDQDCEDALAKSERLYDALADRGERVQRVVIEQLKEEYRELLKQQKKALKATASNEPPPPAQVATTVVPGTTPPATTPFVPSPNTSSSSPGTSSIPATPQLDQGLYSSLSTLGISEPIASGLDPHVYGSDPQAYDTDSNTWPLSLPQETSGLSLASQDAPHYSPHSAVYVPQSMHSTLPFQATPATGHEHGWYGSMPGLPPTMELQHEQTTYSSQVPYSMLPDIPLNHTGHAYSFPTQSSYTANVPQPSYASAHQPWISAHNNHAHTSYSPIQEPQNGLDPRISELFADYSFLTSTVSADAPVWPYTMLKPPPN